MIDVIHTGPLQVNTLVVHLDGSHVFITDPACCPESHDEGVLEEFLDCDNLEPVAVVLTHGHFDHVAGLKAVKRRWPGIPVFISRADSQYLGPQSRDAHSVMLSRMWLDSFLPPCTDLPTADAWLEGGLLPQGLGDWSVIETPGHTPGSVCLYSRSQGTLISGDTVFYHSWGRTDFPGGSERQIQASLEKLYGTLPADTKVYPGHGQTGFALSENF